MVFSFIALLSAFSIAFGRQTAVFGMVKKSLWFFSNYETKRMWFSTISIFFGGFSLWLYPNNSTVTLLFFLTLIFIVLSFIFDFRYVFPEINRVERELGAILNINPDTEIIGVSYKNIAVAYPMDVVVPRHIINDQIADLKIVVSYCAICRSALVFKAEVDGKKLYFKVSAVWRRNMVMIDDQTKSLWQQATGECIYGLYKGKHLTLLSGEKTTWKAWVKKHPNSEFAYKCFEARKAYLSRDSMIKGLNFITPKITPPGFSDLSGLPKKETVFGISFNGISKAYPVNEITQLTNFKDYFNGKTLLLNYNKSASYLTAIDAKTEELIIVEKSWWLGWKEFHPDTEIWHNTLK